MIYEYEVWIKNLKVGDVVIVNSRYHYDKLCKVEEVTKAGNIKVNGILYTASGEERGGNKWYKNHLIQPTPEKVEAIKRERTIRKAFETMKEAKSISYEQAVQILSILEESSESERSLDNLLQQ